MTAPHSEHASVGGGRRVSSSVRGNQNARSLLGPRHPRVGADPRVAVTGDEDFAIRGGRKSSPRISCTQQAAATVETGFRLLARPPESISRSSPCPLLARLILYSVNIWAKHLTQGPPDSCIALPSIYVTSVYRGCSCAEPTIWDVASVAAGGAIKACAGDSAAVGGAGTRRLSARRRCRDVATKQT